MQQVGARCGEIRTHKCIAEKIVGVMPAYNAAPTPHQAYDEGREQGVVDEIILVDDCSRDNTVALARSFEGIQACGHE